MDLSRGLASMQNFLQGRESLLAKTEWLKTVNMSLNLSTTFFMGYVERVGWKIEKWTFQYA